MQLKGRVLLYLDDEDKQFGFLMPMGGGRKIFFHLNDQRYPTLEEDKVVWRRLGVDMTPRIPMTSDEIVYEVGGSQKPKAKRWGFASDLDAIEDRTADMATVSTTAAEERN